jgi:hypothetical protein
VSLDPKSLEFAIKESMLAYPSLFQIREQVLNHYFCVLGNGYDWWDGRLRETCGDEKHEVVVKMLLEGKPEEEIRAGVKSKDDIRLDGTLKEIDELLKKLGVERDENRVLQMFPFRIYPVCDLCAIMKLPDQIRPDWLAGAEEAVNLMETTQSFDDKGTEENRRLVPIIRERIAVLKANQKP